MKSIILIFIVLSMSSCSRHVFKYDHGVLVKDRKPPITKAYSISFAIGLGLGEHFEKQNR